jgi:hypothetical protein
MPPTPRTRRRHKSTPRPDLTARYAPFSFAPKPARSACSVRPIGAVGWPWRRASS